MERVRGLEPLSPAWKAGIIANYTIPAHENSNPQFINDQTLHHHYSTLNFIQTLNTLPNEGREYINVF